MENISKKEIIIIKKGGERQDGELNVSNLVLHLEEISEEDEKDYCRLILFS